MGTNYHCVKSVQIRSFFWSVFSRIRTEYGEMTRKYSVFGHFSHSVLFFVFKFINPSKQVGYKKHNQKLHQSFITAYETIFQEKDQNNSKTFVSVFVMVL